MLSHQYFINLFIKKYCQSTLTKSLGNKPLQIDVPAKVTLLEEAEHAPDIKGRQQIYIFLFFKEILDLICGIAHDWRYDGGSAGPSSNGTRFTKSKREEGTRENKCAPP
jgi:hypothetical protein